VSLWVDPAWRGQGVGDVLVEAVLGWVRAQGYRAVHLWVAADNAPATRLYARHGFLPTGASQPIRPDEPSRREIGMSRAL
jgi:GNAT superfamily N-acetyltransferase